MSTKIPLSCTPDKGKMRSIMRIIIEEPILSLPIPFHEKGILSLAKSFTENGSRLYLSDEDLSFPLFVSRITVNRSVQKLVRLGFLEKRVESREGGKSYRSLKYLGVEQSIKLLQCSNESDESIVSNLYSHSIKTIQCSPSIVSNLYNQSINLIHITKRNLKDHNLKVTERVVADAPLPTETKLKNSLTDLEPVKEPLQTLEEPETSDLTLPPQFREPPLPEPHRFLAAELTAEHRAKLLAQIKSPAQRAGLDPEKLLNEELAACERWSHKDNKKDKFRDCWLATLQRQWIGKKIKELAENPKKPVGPSGLSYMQVETIFRDFWNEAHGLSRLDCRFVTKDQEPFIEKTYKTFAKNEDDFLEFLRKQDPHQFNKQWVQIWMVFKQIESEAAK
jgi:hypothetical protein